MAGAYLTDRQRVELMVPSMLLAVAVQDAQAADGDDPETREVCERCIRDLNEAIDALLPDLKRGDKLRRRARRIRRRVLAPCHGADFGAVMLAIRLLIERLIAEGRIVLHAGSPFDQAWTRFIDALERSPEAEKLDTPERRGEADKLYRAMRRALAEQGVYTDWVEVVT